MKTIALNELVKAPAKVKKCTHAGLSMHVTDHGAPLWVVTPDPDAVGTAARRDAIEQEIAGLLKTRAGRPACRG